jgi:hypothetical protein
MDCLPHFFTTDGRKWNILEMRVCVDFGGRQMQIEAQCDGEWKLLKTFVYHYLTDEFKQWDREECFDLVPVKGKFAESLKIMFDLSKEETQ